MRLSHAILSVIPILISGLISCNQRTTKPELVDSLQIPLKFDHFQISAACYQDQENLYLYHADSARFYQFNFKRKEVTDSFDIESLKGKKFNYCMSDSSLYILHKDPTRMDVFDRQYNKTATFTIETENFISPLFFPLNISEKGLFLYNVPNLNIGVQEEKQKFFSSGILGMFRLDDSSIKLEETFGDFPEQYKSALFNEYYPQATVINDSTLAYIFSLTPTLYVYEVTSGALKQVQVDMLKNKLEPVDMDSLSSFSYLKRYELKNEKYFKLLYDPVAAMFFLFQTHAIAPSGDNGMEINTWKDKPFTVYMFHKDGKVVGSKEFNAIGDYVVASFYTYEHRLYLGKLSGNQFAFEVYAY